MPRFVQDPKTLKLVPVEEYRARVAQHALWGDFEPFVSHVDGTVIDSRKKLREHNARHGVVSHAELGNEGEAARREREKHYSAGGYDNDRRRDAIIFAADVESSGRSTAEKKQMAENYRNINKPREW